MLTGTQGTVLCVDKICINVIEFFRVINVPRQARRKSESGIYHILLRGINRQQIFEDNEDFEKFLEVLKAGVSFGVARKLYNT